MFGRAQGSRYKNPPYKSISVVFVGALAGLVVFCAASFRGTFTETAPVTVVSPRSGLIMEVGSKVKLHGVEIGHVDGIATTGQEATISLALDPSRLPQIPSNALAEIKPTTIFGAKYIELVTPDGPAGTSLTAGARIRTLGVTAEINTVFQDIVAVMNKIQPEKLDATLTAIAEGLQGRGDDLGQTIVRLDDTLVQLNPQLPRLQSDLRSTAAAAQTLGDAGTDLMSILRNATVTSDSIVEKKDDLAALLVSAIGLGSTGNTFLGENRNGIVDSMRLLTPTTALLAKYSPGFPCMFHLGALNAANEPPVIDETGYSASMDVGLLGGDDPYVYPENLPIVGAKGGPHTEPGCYAPTTWENYPAPYLRMNTGAPLNGPGSDHPKFGNPSIIEYLLGTAPTGEGRR
ncbi:MCE family protein [Nocardia jinanensis]|uniref:MCE-family protein MCE1A n=1 Tax=Nocardia jinanensis TaxID=382504 RepID=A0A917RLH0_9NOCA|nr:MCE family protein [Nocardia jinanensis]GGL13136.1 MCE-family protein MCE1A [Nocardia jinanensis]